MKKEFTFFLIALVLIFAFVQHASAESAGDAKDILKSEFGLSDTEIPTDPEAIKELYLKTQWADFAANNAILGPIHTFLTKMSWLFWFLFARPYEFSFALIITVILWFMAAGQSGKLAEALGVKKGWIAFGVGVLAAIAIAQIRLLGAVVDLILELIFKPDAWWMRAIVIVVFVVLFVIEQKASKALNKHLKEKKKRDIESKFEQSQQRAEKFTEGAGI
ncbi:MAG: hypothetical protein ABH864_05475 [archaeon]